MTASECILCGSKMPRFSSKAPATISTPPPDKVVGGPRVIADVSDCANNAIASVNDECTKIVSGARVLC